MILETVNMLSLKLVIPYCVISAMINVPIICWWRGSKSKIKPLSVEPFGRIILRGVCSLLQRHTIPFLFTSCTRFTNNCKTNGLKGQNIHLHLHVSWKRPFLLRFILLWVAFQFSSPYSRWIYPDKVTF